MASMCHFCCFIAIYIQKSHRLMCLQQYGFDVPFLLFYSNIYTKIASFNVLATISLRCAIFCFIAIYIQKSHRLMCLQQYGFDVPFLLFYSNIYTKIASFNVLATIWLRCAIFVALQQYIYKNRIVINRDINSFRCRKTLYQPVGRVLNTLTISTTKR